MLNRQQKAIIATNMGIALLSSVICAGLGIVVGYNVPGHTVTKSIVGFAVYAALSHVVTTQYTLPHQVPAMIADMEAAG